MKSYTKFLFLVKCIETFKADNKVCKAGKAFKLFTSWFYCTNVANLHIRIFEIKCYFHNLIVQLISFMVCSWRRQDYRIVHTISISIQNRDYDCSEFTPESIVSAVQKKNIGL